ncbi:hypothetical protein F4780DRAFT_26671 [Xylariomycetidae sp. FL0641]|nr:hypothetical protein F4780DRAFT_26671 [Xylariomycetidae sp. FL0641]
MMSFLDRHMGILNPTSDCTRSNSEAEQEPTLSSNSSTNIPSRNCNCHCHGGILRSGLEICAGAMSTSLAFIGSPYLLSRMGVLINGNIRNMDSAQFDRPFQRFLHLLPSGSEITPSPPRVSSTKAIVLIQAYTLSTLFLQQCRKGDRWQQYVLPAILCASVSLIWVMMVVGFGSTDIIVVGATVIPQLLSVGLVCSAVGHELSRRWRGRRSFGTSNAIASKQQQGTIKVEKVGMLGA